MRKIINEPEEFVNEFLEGVLAAHPHQLRSVGPDLRAIVRADAPIRGQVGIVTGGGSGHLPLFMGYVGKGLCSGVAIGNVFSSPSPEQVLAATKACDGGAGVLYLYGNYGGDVFTFDLASEDAEAAGITVATVLGADDVMSAPAERAESRRGVAGIFFAYKIAGSAAERGYSLEKVTGLAARTVAETRTAGVGLSPTILPAAGKPTFELPDGDMEIGIGIHGEPGVMRGAIESADAITERLLSAISSDLHLKSADRVAVLVNGLGATPLEELYVVYRAARRLLDEHGVIIERSFVGEFATSLEMAGASLSVLRVDDDLLSLLDDPANSPFFAQEVAR